MNNDDASVKTDGDGIALIAEDFNLYAPEDGIIRYDSNCQNKIYFETSKGVKLSICLYKGSEKIDKEDFKLCADSDMTVHQGDLIAEFNEKAENLNVLIIVDNIDEYIRAVPMVKENEDIENGEVLLVIV